MAPRRELERRASNYNLKKRIMYGTIKDLIPKMMDLDPNKIYEIKEKPNQKTAQQNRGLWEMIHKIAKYEEMDDMDVYCAILEKADAKSDYIITAEDRADDLRKSFRGVKFIRMQEVNGKDCYVYKVYLGSSKMNRKELSELLEIVNYLAAERGIPTIEDYNFERFYGRKI